MIKACTWTMVPLGVILLFALSAQNEEFRDAAQTATAGLTTLIPEGLVLLMSVTFAVAAVRLAKRDTLIQQISATESLAAVDTICVDKTGTLTDGELMLRGVLVAAGDDEGAVHRALARFAASAGDRNRTLQAISDRFPSSPGSVTAEVPFSSEWKWSGLTLNGSGAATSYVMGAPDVLARQGALELPQDLQRALEQETAAGRRVVAFGETPGALPRDPAAAAPPTLRARALVVMEENLRPDARATVEFMRQQNVDLKLISGDARATVTAVARGVGLPEDAGVIDGADLPTDRARLARAAVNNSVFCRIKPEQKKALVSALADGGRYTAMIGDGVNDVPALKTARMAVAMGSGTQVTKGVADVVLMNDDFSRLPEAVAEGRRIARNIHRLGRLYLTKSVYAAALILLVAVPGFAFPFLPRHLTLAAFLTIGIPSFVLALAPSDGPLYRGRLLRALAAFAVPAGLGIAVGSILSFFLVDTVFGGTLAEGRTAATTTLVVLGLSFVLLLERGPGREHIAIQSYMLGMVVVLGALFALGLAATPVREFFDMELLTAAEWFLALLAAAAGLVVASLLWHLPQIEALEDPDAVPPDSGRMGVLSTIRGMFERRRREPPRDPQESMPPPTHTRAYPVEQPPAAEPPRQPPAEAQQPPAAEPPQPPNRPRRRRSTMRQRSTCRRPATATRPARTSRPPAGCSDAGL